MRKIIILLSAVAAFTACNQSKPVVDTAKEEQALMAADKDFCTVEQAQGEGKAIDKYYDNDVVTISPGTPFAQGKAAIMKQMADTKMDTMTRLVWAADKVSVSSSGDLGYVWGHYHINSKTTAGTDTIYNGVYCTIYKKGADGNWKAVVDMNN